METLGSANIIEIIRFGIREVRRTQDTIKILVSNKNLATRLAGLSNQVTPDVKITIQVKRFGDPVMFLIFSPRIY